MITPYIEYKRFGEKCGNLLREKTRASAFKRYFIAIHSEFSISRRVARAFNGMSRYFNATNQMEN